MSSNQPSDEQHKTSIMEQDIAIVKKMANIDHKIAVMSGKGGVGKSTVSVNLAEALAIKGYRTGLLDVDIHGPNIPLMLGVEGKALKIDSEGISPVKTADGIEVMSIGFLLPAEDSPIIWRGPKKTGAIRQFLADVTWGQLNFLVIDNPPGTGDEPLTILQSIPSLDGVVIVTTPSSVALEDVEKCVSMAKSLNIRVIGIIENMSEFICPKCGQISNIFGSGGGERLAKKMNIPFLGKLPIDLSTISASEGGVPLVAQKKCQFSEIMNEILKKIEKEISR